MYRKVIKALKNQGQSPQASQREEKLTWWASLDPKQRKLISNIAIGLGISLVAAITIYIGIKVVKNKISNNEENKSLGTDKYATWAKQIDNSFINNGWWGTDEVLLRRVLQEIPSKEDFEKVQKSYKKFKKGDSLISKMTDELKQTEYNEMLAIINAKPETAEDAKNGVVIYDPRGWAKRLNYAFNYNWLGFLWGTDMEAITAVVVELPSQKAFVDTAKAYYDLYGNHLIDDLADEISQEEIDDYKKKILRKPKV